MLYSADSRSLRANHYAAALRLESFTLKNRSLFAQSFCAQFACGLLLAVVTLGLTCLRSATSTSSPSTPSPTGPSRPASSPSASWSSVTANGSQGGLQILDGLRDIRSNIQNTMPSFSITGYSSGYPSLILNFPEQIRGYVYSNTDGSLANINYGTESTTGSVGTFPARSTSIAVAADFGRIVSGAKRPPACSSSSTTPPAATYALNLPNVYQVAVNQGDTVILAMVRNSNTLYRVVKLNATISPIPPGAGRLPALQPARLLRRPRPRHLRPPGRRLLLARRHHRLRPQLRPRVRRQHRQRHLPPAGRAQHQQHPHLPCPTPTAVTANRPRPRRRHHRPLRRHHPLPRRPATASPTASSPATSPPSTSPPTPSPAPYSISDGTHSKLLFADDNTLWIGSQFCATGERAKLGQNYNCLTRFDSRRQDRRTIVPDVTPGSATATVPYPNTNHNLYYYGSLTGLCWVQNYHKVYTAYGGQVHAFNTADGSEINNQYITVQGTALDVAYMDALTNAAD